MAATTFDVGGYKLAAEVSGEGSPTVVFVSGGGDDGEPWVIPALRSSTSILTYARAGIGGSETPDDSGPRSVGAAPEELGRCDRRRLVGNAGLPEVFLPIVVQSGRYSSRGTAFACAISR
jgi:pimeloyl-ACP methyl ester carboxylesterase